MIEIQRNLPTHVKINLQMIKLGVKKTLKEVNNPEVDITIRLTDDDEIRELNQSFRGIPDATDVLSFTQDIIDPDTHRQYLGDIIISYERAQQQALEQEHPLNQECTLLAIHGTLHLLGYDHYEEGEKQIMWELQERILRETINHFQGKTS